MIGNGGGGKTTLARRLAALYDLPLSHVDSIQYLAGFARRPEDETRLMLKRLADQERWLIDGFGPLDVIAERFARADAIIFVDFPLWRHYFWAGKRQIRAAWSPRSELPEGCSEAGLGHTLRLFRILWRVHMRIRPRLIELMLQPGNRSRLIWVRNLSDWQSVAQGKLNCADINIAGGDSGSRIC